LRGPPNGPRPPERALLGLALANLADTLLERGAFEEARLIAQEAVELYRSHTDWSAHDRIHATRVLASANFALGQLDAAEAQIRELLRELQADPKSDNEALSPAIALLTSILQRQGRLEEIEKLYRDGLPAIRARLGPDDPKLAGSLAQLAAVLLVEHKFAEAEPFARECLTIREKTVPEQWLTFNTRSLLGASLLGQERYAEAEPLLLSGYRGMEERADQIPMQAKNRLKEALQHLVRLYEVTDRADQAAQWKQKLDDFERSQTNQPPAAPTPAKP
jgi:tetratricopeptide (TPR) repeat protein